MPDHGPSLIIRRAYARLVTVRLARRSGSAITTGSPVRDAGPVRVHRAGDRFLDEDDGITTRHSFSFGRHYDGTNTSYGLLLVNDETVLGAGVGFDPHPHRDVDVVTWVLSGSLRHTDSLGTRAVATPGTVQRMCAGSGIVHAERNPGDEPAHYVQMWVAGAGSGPPGYAQEPLDEAALDGRLSPVASGAAGRGAPLRLGSPSATLHAGRLEPGQAVTLPDAPWVHLAVTRGAVQLEGAGLPEGVGPLEAGDAARLTSGGRRVTATASAKLLVWEMHASL